MEWYLSRDDVPTEMKIDFLLRGSFRSDKFVGLVEILIEKMTPAEKELFKDKLSRLDHMKKGHQARLKIAS